MKYNLLEFYCITETELNLLVNRMKNLKKYNIRVNSYKILRKLTEELLSYDIKLGETLKLYIKLIDRDISDSSIYIKLESIKDNVIYTIYYDSIVLSKDIVEFLINGADNFLPDIPNEYELLVTDNMVLNPSRRTRCSINISFYQLEDLDKILESYNISNKNELYLYKGSSLLIEVPSNNYPSENSINLLYIYIKLLNDYKFKRL